MARLPSTAVRSLVLLAAVAVALCLWPASAGAALKGIDTDLTWGTSSGTQTQTANAMQDLGAQWTRLTISWHDVETRQGSYSSSVLSATDNAVSLARARGIHVLMDVIEAPSWETGSSDKNTPPRNNADYTKFLRDMAVRYRGQVEAWEIWNEENIQRFWSTGVNPAQYANLLAASYPVVKAADSNAKVLFGGLSTNDVQFLQAAYAAVPNLGSYFDVMATHPYPGWDANAAPDLTIRDSGGQISRVSFDSYRDVRATMLAHGDDKPLWFTELGWSTWSGGVSQQTQAAFVTKAYQCVEQDPYVQVVFYYNLRNNWWAHDADDWEDQLGLTSTSWSNKLAYAAYKAYAPGNTGCTYHEADGTPTYGGQPPAPSPGTSGSAPGGQTSSTPPAVSQPPGSAPPAVTSPRATRTKVRVKAVAIKRRSGRARVRSASLPIAFRIDGVVEGGTGGRVALQLEYASHGRWTQAAGRSLTVGADGSFSSRFSSRHAGKWRVRAVFLGTPGREPSTSAYAPFRLVARL